MREIIESIIYLWAAFIMRVNLLILETKRFREKSTGMVFSINCDSILYIIYSKRMKIWRLNKKSFVFLLFIFTCILIKIKFFERKPIRCLLYYNQVIATCIRKLSNHLQKSSSTIVPNRFNKSNSLRESAKGREKKETSNTIFWN